MQCLLVFRVLLCVFAGIAYLIFCGTKNALIASTVIIPSSHNISTSLCCCNVDYFIPVVASMKCDCKTALNIIVRKLYVVGTCKPFSQLLNLFIVNLHPFSLLNYNFHFPYLCLDYYSYSSLY